MMNMTDYSNIQFAKRSGIKYGGSVFSRSGTVMSYEWPADEILIYGDTFKQMIIDGRRDHFDHVSSPEIVLWTINHEVLHGVIFHCMYDGTDESVKYYNSFDDHWAHRNGLEEPKELLDY